MISFTNQQIKDLSQGLLDAPAAIANAQASQTAAIANKAKILAKDQANEVYTLNWANIIAQYNAELKYLNGVSKADYNLADVAPAGQLKDPNIHFPASPIWIGFQPKVALSNLGNPTAVWASTEAEATTRVTDNIALLKTGFTDGSANTTTTAAFVADEVDVTSVAGLSVGNRVIFTQGSDYLFGTIDDITLPLTLKIVDVLSSGGFAGIASGATLKNFHPGWTLPQREGGTGAGAGDVAFQAAIKLLIDGAVGDWDTRLDAEKTALTANDAKGAEATQIAAALAQVNGHRTAISTWEGFPSIGVGTSRFGTNLPALESDIASRPAEMTARASEITSALGTLTQNPDGTYSGAGNYFNLFDNLNLRLNKAGGTLRVFYDSDLGVQLFAQQVVNLQNQQARDAATFTLKTFSADADGTNVVSLSDVTGLVIAQAVKIMSSTQAVIDAVINDIIGNDVELSVTVPATYLVAEQARLVRVN